jgi:type IV pilus assembly protein PilE
MVVVVIIAILAAVGYPMYTKSVQSSNRTTVQGDLEAAAAAMNAARSQSFSFKNAALGASGVFRDRSPDTGDQKYQLVFMNGGVAGSANADPNGFIIVAQPVGSAAGTGSLGIDNFGQRCWNKSNDTSCTPGASGQEW